MGRENYLNGGEGNIFKSNAVASEMETLTLLTAQIHLKQLCDY